MSFCAQKLIQNVLIKPYCRSASTVCPLPPRDPVVTVLDACSTIGTNLALLLKQNPNIREVRVFDEEKDATGIAIDLSQIDTKTKVKCFKPSAMRAAVTDADIVISTGGCQEKAGQSQRGLFEKNVDNVRNAAIFLAEFNPRAVYCIAKPPIEALVPMVSEEYRKAEVYDYRKIIGITSGASMIANTFIARHFGKDPTEVLCPVVGGFSPKATIPVISQTKPVVEFSPNLFAQLQESVANAEEALVKNGGAFCFSHTVAISRFIHSLVKALKGEQNCVECAYVGQPGHIGEFLPYMTSIIKLGREGITSTHMPKVNEQEGARLKMVMADILENIILGQTFVSGDFSALSKIKNKGKCDVALKEKIQEFHLRAQTSCVQSRN